MSNRSEPVTLRPIHPFPARMAPGIALRHLKSKQELRVLDPMAGSGTVVRVAAQLGHQALGFDTDPLALMISEAWCNAPDPEALRRTSLRVLRRSKDWRNMASNFAYPPGTDDETRLFIRYWFDANARRQLTALLREIRKVDDRSIRLYLQTALSRAIVTKDKGISRARDVSHSRPHRAYKRAPISPRKAFKDSVNRLARVTEMTTKPAGRAVVREGDARSLPLRSSSVDVVMTSPPYLNAIDYLRGHKLALVWFGFNVGMLRSLRAANIGAEVSSDSSEITPELEGQVYRGARPQGRKRGILARYIADISKLMTEMWRVVKPGGKCIVVVGDCNVGKTFVRNSQIVSLIAKSCGFTLLEVSRRRIRNARRYLPPPSSARAGVEMSKRIRTEVVLVFRKPKSGTGKRNTR